MKALAVEWNQTLNVETLKHILLCNTYLYSFIVLNYIILICTQQQIAYLYSRLWLFYFRVQRSSCRTCCDTEKKTLQIDCFTYSFLSADYYNIQVVFSFLSLMSESLRYGLVLTFKRICESYVTIWFVKCFMIIYPRIIFYYIVLDIIVYILPKWPEILWFPAFIWVGKTQRGNTFWQTATVANKRAFLLSVRALLRGCRKCTSP